MYGKRSNGKEHGVVLTKLEVVKSMLDLVGYSPKHNLNDTIIIEPSAGEGVFALEIINRLYLSSLKHCFDFLKALSNIYLYDINKESIKTLTDNIQTFIDKKNIIYSFSNIFQEDYLLADIPKADIIIGNPPYVRHENIPKDLKRNYRLLFKTFNNRGDLYIPFFEKSLSSLKVNGSLCFISSNRWLKNQYGKDLRNLISLRYSLNDTINLEKASPFEEEVIAYPSIFYITNNDNGIKSRFYELENINELPKVVDSSIKPQRVINIKDVKHNWFSHHTYELSNRTNLSHIEQQGFKIGIGVATGRDSVFIRKDFHSLVESELLLPLLMSKDLRGDNFIWQGNYIINPFNKSGSLIDLDKYPLAKKYFFKHEEELKKRHVARKSSDKWYKTIDKINPQITSQPKILLPDITGNKYIFIDKGEYYPHHNLYYISSNNIDDLKILACILMSDLGMKQLLENGNKMNGGYIRWQSQNLRKLIIPQILSFPERLRNDFIKAYDTKDIALMNILTSRTEIFEYKSTVGQLTIFEPSKNYSYHGIAN